MEAEEKARDDGWKAQDEWNGDPDKWISAEKFNERGEKITPLLKAKLDRVEKELSMATKVNKQVLTQVRKQAHDQATKEYEDKLAKLSNDQMEAIEAGDTEEFQKIQTVKDKIDKPEEQKADDENPEFEDWNKKNTWYAPDPGNVGEADLDLTEMANGIAAGIKGRDPNIQLSDLFDQVESKIKKNFPDKFTNQNREKPNMGGSGNHSPSQNTKGKKFSDIPANHRASYRKQADNFKLEGIEFSEKEYAEIYFEEE